MTVPMIDITGANLPVPRALPGFPRILPRHPERGSLEHHRPLRLWKNHPPLLARRAECPRWRIGVCGRAAPCASTAQEPALCCRIMGSSPGPRWRRTQSWALKIRGFYGPDGKHSPKDANRAPGEEQALVDHWLSWLGILSLKEKYPEQLSRGQRPTRGHRKDPCPEAGPAPDG